MRKKKRRARSRAVGGVLREGIELKERPRGVLGVDIVNRYLAVISQGSLGLQGTGGLLGERHTRQGTLTRNEALGATGNERWSLSALRQADLQPLWYGFYYVLLWV